VSYALWNHCTSLYACLRVYLQLGPLILSGCAWLLYAFEFAQSEHLRGLLLTVRLPKRLRFINAGIDSFEKDFIVPTPYELLVLALAI